MQAKGITRALLAGLVVLVGFGSTQSTTAADFPSKPITLVAPFGPGGPSDIIARSVAEQVNATTGKHMVVINKPGASATLGTAEVFRAEADGYTVLLGDNIATAFQPLRMKLPYDGPQDFQPIIKLAVIPNVLVVRADSKWRTLEDFVKEAKARPESMRVATAGQFTGTDLNMREFDQVAGIRTTTVPSSSGSGKTLALLLGGHVEAIVAAPAAVVSNVKGGKMRPIAVFSSKRVDLFPDVPSTHELGYKTTMNPTVFISAPKGLNNAVLKTLHGILEKAVTSPKFAEFTKRTGYQLDPLGPEALAKELHEWRNYFTSLAKRLNISPAQ